MVFFNFKRLNEILGKTSFTKNNWEFQKMAQQTADFTLKKVIENFLTDLRLAAAETKRKHPNIKELCDASILKIRSIQTNKPIDLASGIRDVSTDLIEPFLLAVDARIPRLNQISLQAVQKLIMASLISESAAGKVVEMMSVLVEMEALKVLQTLLQLVTTDSIVVKASLQRTMAICINLTFSKEGIIANTAEATVKQLVNTIFDRIDEKKLSVDRKVQGESSVSTLDRQIVFLQDAETFIKDLCTNVTNEQSQPRTTSEVSPILGIELLENVLQIYYQKLIVCPTLLAVIKDHVCKLVLKLISPCTKLKIIPGTMSSTGGDQEINFGLYVRLFRIMNILISRYTEPLIMECEIFLNHLIRFLENDKPQWLKILSCEIIHYLIAQPNLIRLICSKYDLKSSSTKIYGDLVSAIGNLAQSEFSLMCRSNTGSNGVQQTSDVAFFYRGISVPLLSNPQGEFYCCW